MPALIRTGPSDNQIPITWEDRTAEAEQVLRAGPVGSTTKACGILWKAGEIVRSNCSIRKVATGVGDRRG